MLDLTVRVVPLETVFVIARDPHLAINFGVISVAKVDLTAEVTLFIRIVALVAKLAEADPFFTPLQLHLREFQLQTLLCQRILFSKAKTHCLLGVKWTAELVVARFFRGIDS